ncbi:MAG: aminotransferase class IV [Bacteroidia bacterium]|jgi:branched-chain amino acid aminotransferase|nr:aminotransferase class IV [Bacteroidia bacterium]
MSISRAFVYGDLLFETMRLQGGRLCLADLHFERLTAGMNQLGYPLPDDWRLERFEALVYDKLKSGLVDARVRLVAYRDGNGFYVPSNEEIKFDVSFFERVTPATVLNTCCIYRTMQKSFSPIAAYKTGNALLYVEAARYAAQHGYDDALILNTEGRIIEATSSNIFWINNNNLFTTPLSEGPINGVMRRYLINRLKQVGVIIQERVISEVELKRADAVFITNSLHPIRIVKQVEDTVYPQHDYLEAMQYELNISLNL